MDPVCVPPVESEVEPPRDGESFLLQEQRETINKSTSVCFMIYLLMEVIESRCIDSASLAVEKVESPDDPRPPCRQLKTDGRRIAITMTYGISFTIENLKRSGASCRLSHGFK